MSEPIPALLVMHADLAAALLRAAELVYGAIERVEVLSNEGLSRADLEREVERRVDHWRSGGLVFTDMAGGSPHISCSAVARAHGEIVVVTGLNLPTLLDFLHNRDRFGVVELAERLRVKGQDSIRIQRGQKV